MPKLLRIFDPRGCKVGYLILSIVANVAWAILFFSLVDTMMQSYGDRMTGVDTTLMLGVFLGTVSIAFFVAVLAKDRRGLSYGVYGGLAGLVVIVLMTWKSGLLAVLVGGMALLGGYNGGSLGEMMQRIRRNKGPHDVAPLDGNLKQ